MQILSFDFGTKKIGIAVGQTITKSSSPLTVLFNKDNKVNWEEVNHIVREWKPDLLLIGKPLNMDGTDSDIMKLVEKFSKKNPNRIVYFKDQTLHFNRIDRDEVSSVIYNLEQDKVEYTDYHMPIPFSQYKDVIEKIYELSVKNGNI